MKCPNCYCNNPVGTLFCIDCAMPLEDDQDDLSNLPQGGLAAKTKPVLSLVKKQNHAGLRLVVIENLNPTGESITLPPPPYDEPIILGRNDLAKGTVVDVDFMKAGGREKGVSRLHAKISADDRGYTLEDVGSTHGTWVNKKRIKTGEVHSIKDGDEIRFAKLVMKVLSN